LWDQIQLAIILTSDFSAFATCGAGTITDVSEVHAASISGSKRVRWIVFVYTHRFQSNRVRARKEGGGAGIATLSGLIGWAVDKKKVILYHLSYW
jgi:hypothetical protein